jgi:hypothetical protein
MPSRWNDQASVLPAQLGTHIDSVIISCSSVNATLATGHCGGTITGDSTLLLLALQHISRSERSKIQQRFENLLMIWLRNTALPGWRGDSTLAAAAAHAWALPVVQKVSQRTS